MSTALKSKKKPELQALASELSIDTDGSKADLEARILQHLSQHTDLKADNKYKKYFAAITGPESPGLGTVAPLGGHKRRNIAAKKSTELGDSISKALTRYLFTFAMVDSDSDEEGIMGSEMVKKTKRTAGTVAKTADSKTRGIMSSIPGSVPSPARVTSQIELATSPLVRRARSASSSLQLHQVTSRVPVVRQAVSNVVSVDGIAGLTELTLLMNKLIPRTYPVSSCLMALISVTSPLLVCQDCYAPSLRRANLPPRPLQTTFHRRLLETIPLVGFPHHCAAPRVRVRNQSPLRPDRPTHPLPPIPNPRSIVRPNHLCSNKSPPRLCSLLPWLPHHPR
jgi:hypothetical protein